MKKLGAAVATMSMWVASVAFAQDPSSRAAEFRAVSGPHAEQVPGGMLLWSAYIVAWMGIFLFVIRIQRKMTKTADAIEKLEELASVKRARELAGGALASKEPG